MIYQYAPAFSFTAFSFTAFGLDMLGFDSKPASQGNPQTHFVPKTMGGRRIFASPLLHRELIPHHARL